MSDLNIAKPTNEPKIDDKAVTINVLKSRTDADLRATFQAIQKSFGIQTPDFYHKLGDLMLSNQTFSVSSFKERFLNLINEYSQGVVYQGQSGGQTRSTNDIGSLGVEENKKTNKSYINYSTNNSKSLIPESDPASTFNFPLNKTTADERLLSVKTIDATQVKTTSSSTNILIDNAINSILELANRTGTSNNIDIFLYNTLPYIAGGAISSYATTIATAVTTANGGPNFLNPSSSKLTPADLMGAAYGVITGNQNPLGLLGTFAYYTPEELVYLTLANFYTLHIRRGISIKDMSTGGMIFTPNVILSKPEVQDAANKITSPDLYNLINLFIYDSDNKLNYSDVARQDIIKLPSAIEAKDATTIIKNKDGSTRKETISYNGETFDDIERQTKEWKGLWKIGCLYIWPLDKTVAEPKIIPFEFNPIITEGDVAARYQSQAILSRIGELQSYVGTASLTITLSTSYYTLGEMNNEPNIDSFGNPSQLDHLNYFNLENLQKIELAYRSLTLPFFYQNSSIDSGYKYVRPPLVKVIMGDYKQVESENTVYANLLNYPYAVIKDKFSNIGEHKFRRYKTFICTSARIGKPEEFPYYITQMKGIVDTMGYTVDLSLTEVSPSYIQALPSFKDFYDAATPTTPRSK
jgi:hypothetical protein